MTESDTALALINAYKARGIDLSVLLEDPLFVKLKPETRIQAIQTYAHDFQTNTSRGMTGTDWAGVASNVVMTAIPFALAGHALAPKFPGLAKGTTATAGAVFGTMAGGLTSALKMADIKSRRLAAARELEKLKADPSAENAVGVLSGSHMRSGGAALKTRLLDSIAGEITGNMRGQLPDYMHRVAQTPI